MNRCALLVLGLLSAGPAHAADDPVFTGNAAKARHDYPAALAAYTQAVAQHPNDPRVHILRGSMRAKLGDFPGAIADDDAALALDPKNVIAFTNRGNARAAQSDFAGALADYNRALALDPRHAAAFLNRGNVEAEQQDYRAALADDNQVLVLHPNDLLARYNRAGAKRALGDYAGAIADYSQVLAAQPADVRALLNRAIVRMALRDWSGARTDLRKCLAPLAPDKQIYPRLYLWVVAVKQGRAADAVEEMQAHIRQLSAAYAATWPAELEKFCVGGVAEPQLLLDAMELPPGKARNAFAQACYFDGIRSLTDPHDTDGPATLFRKCIATGDPKLHEVILAREELKALGGATP